MKHVLSLFILIGVFLSTVPAQAGESAYDQIIRTGTIRCGYFTWPPYILKDPNTKALSGINYDFMTEIGKRLDLKIDWVEETSAGSALEGLNTGRYDVMCASLWPDAARAKNALLTVPEFYSSVYAVSRTADTRFDNKKMVIDDPTVTAVGIEGDVTYSIASTRLKSAKILALPQMSDSSLILQSIASKKADVSFIDKGTIADFNKTNGDLLKVIPGLPPVSVFPESLAVRGDEMRLARLLDQTIRNIVDDGTAELYVSRYPAYGYFSPTAGWAAGPKSN